MSSFYTRIKLGGRLAEAEAGRQAGRKAGRRSTGSLRQTHNGTAGWIWQSRRRHREMDGPGRTDGRTEQEDEEGGKEEEERG